ncbi:MAG: hypothetical protein ACYSWO_01755 [Planctomycetota bacterium]|jgi:hypothetical protein
MKHTEDIEELVERSYLNNLHVPADAEMDGRILDDAVNKMEESRRLGSVLAGPNMWRIIMKNRTIRFTTAAVVLIAAALTICHLGASPDGTSVTFAQVMDQIREFRPYAYTQATRYHDRDKTVVRRFMILNRHQRREEFPGGIVRIFDFSEEPVGMLQLNPDTKRALWKTYPDMQTMAINPDTLAMLRRFEERPDIHKVEDRGEQEMDGHTTKCFHVPGERNVYTLWVEIETKLPVRIELEHPTLKHTLIMTEFDFDPSFDKTQFDRIPPEGYTFSNETHLIDGLRFLAKFMGGAFPKALEWPKIQQQMRTYTQESNLEISPVQLKEMRAAIGPLNEYVGRLRSSPESFDLHYVGDGVRLGEADTVVLWYRPEGTSGYRVVYGDLRVEDAAPEDIPK